MTSRILTAAAVSALAFTSVGCKSGPAGSQSSMPQPAGHSVAATVLAKAKPSLVVVRFTYEGEVGKRDLDGQGIVIDDQGTVVFSMALTPAQLADEQLKDFKIVLPGDEEEEIEADFLGRDERNILSFVRPKTTATSTPSTQPAKSHKWTPLNFVAKPVAAGDDVISVGLLPKSAGYTPYVIRSAVSSTLRGPFPQVLVGSTGLTVTGSPVFNVTGDLIGFVNAQADSTPLLNDPRNAMAYVENAPRIFTPASDFLEGVKHPPTLDKPILMPSIGIAQPKGLTKDVAEYYKLKGQPAVQIGDVIPDFPAAKAGLKAGNVIVKLNGKVLERGDLPEETPQIMLREISRLNPGDVVTLTVITAPGAASKDVKVTLEERPAGVNKAARFYAEDLGFTSRDVTFEDTYARKLPAKSKGAIVAFVRPQSTAQTATLQLNDMITKINQTPVESVAQFKEQYAAFRKAKPKEAVVLEVLRVPSTQIIRIEPPQE